MTKEEIYDAFITEKDTFSSLSIYVPAGDSSANLLADVSSGSKVSVWRLFAWLHAFINELLHNFFDLHKVEVQTLAANSKLGQLKWYVEIAKLFQLGDVLNEENLGYDLLDTSKQIVKYASSIEDNSTDRTVFLKVAKDVSGNPTALTSQELTQFTAYIHKIKPAGIRILPSSLNADTLRLTATIEYDPILFFGTVEDAVIEAIDEYLAALPFDGTVRRLALEDAIQNVQGVTGITITVMQGVQGAVVTSFTQEYVTAAGFILLDENNTTFTMQADI